MTRYWVKVTPRAAADSIDVAEDGTMHIRVRVAPVDNAANDAVMRLVAERLDVPRSRVTILAGSTARKKLVAVDES